MGTKISQLTTILTSQLTDDDVIPVVDLNPGGTPRTRKVSLTGLFDKAPVKSINGISTGDVSLASTNLTDASTIGRILNINGYSSGNVSLGSGDLTNSSNIALHTKLGSVAQFTAEYNNPTTAQLQTEYEELARLLGNDVSNVRTSLFAVQTTANNAMPTSTANNTFATKTSLGDYSKTTDIANNYYNKTETASLYATNTNLTTNYSTSTQIANTYATQQYVTNQINASSGSNVSIFNVVGLDASGDVSIGGNLAVSNNLSIGAHITCEDLTASDLIKGLRAEIGDGTANTTRLTIDGDAEINGKLKVTNLRVEGNTEIVNTQIVEISDDFIELNKDLNGNATSGTSGFKVNRGATADKAILQWNESTQKFEFKLGNVLAPIDASNLGSGSGGSGNVTNIPTTTSIYSIPRVSVNALGNNINVYEQVSLGMSINAFPVEQTCCSLQWGGLTELKDLRAQVLRNTNTLCTGVNMFNIEKGFEFSTSNFAGSLSPPPQLPTGAFTAPNTTITTTITPTGTGSTTTQVSIGARNLQGAYINFYLDTSGSMNYFLPRADQSILDMRTYLQSLYYDNATEANQYIPAGNRIGNERWMSWMADINGNQQLNIAIINESHSVYHSWGGSSYLESSQFTSDFTTLQNNFNQNKAGGSTNFHRGIVFALNDYSIFVQHLNHVFSAYPISSFGTNIEYNVQGSFSADQLSEYVLQKVNLPDQANKTQPALSAYDSGVNASQVQWNATANLQNLTGTFNAGASNKFTATMSGWQIEIYNVLADGTKNFQALVDLGTKLPTSIVYQTIGNEPTKEFTARIIAKSNNGNPDGVSAYSPCNVS